MQGPVQERGEFGGPRGVGRFALALGGSGCGGQGGARGRVRGGGPRVGGVGVVDDLAALGAQFRDALAQQVQELVDGDGPGGQLEEGEHLGHGRDDLGDGGGLLVPGFGGGQRPGVEQGDPAAQHGAVVAVPGAQPPAGAGAVAVHLDQTGEAGGVPVGPDPVGGQTEVAGGAFGGRVGQGGLAVGGRRLAAGAERRVRPAGDPGGGGQSGASHSGQLRGGGRALRRAGRGAARAPLVHS